MSKPSAAAFAARGVHYLGRSYAEMDCQQLVEAMLQDVGIRHNWPGSNAMYRDMAWSGTPEECVRTFGHVPAGAWLYILEPSGAEPARYRGDGIGNASHVGVKTGTGKGAVHASATRGCVAESSFNDKTVKNGGWNRVGLCDLLDYGLTIGKDEPMTETATVTATSGSTVNLRTAPDGPLLARLPLGTCVTVTGRSNGWCSVTCGELSGWMMAEFLSPAPADDPFAARLSDVERRLDAVETRLAALDGGLG